MGEVVMFDEAGAVPAHLVGVAGNNNDLSNGVGGGGYPVISYKGKVWHITQGDKKILVAHEDGEPKSSIDVVILRSNPHLSKIYYAGGYQEGSSEKPTCFSNNGIAPDDMSTSKQSTTCAACPHNAWGSKISEQGAKGKACSDSRRLAVAPMGDMENAMLLRVPAGTLKDLSAYADMLNRRKASYSALVTRISFDHTVAHQKFLFKPTRWLTAEEFALVQEVSASAKVENITGAEIGGLDLPGEAPTPAVAAPVVKTTPKVEPTVVQAPPEVEAEVVAPAAPKPAPSVIAEVDNALSKALSMLDD